MCFWRFPSASTNLMRKKAQTLTLLLLTSRKPDHCSSSSLMPSAPASLPSLPQLSLISNPCNFLFWRTKTAFFLIEKISSTMHKAWHYYIFPGHTEKRKRTIYPTICHPHFHFCEMLILAVWTTVTSQNHDMKIFTTVTWIGRRHFEIASSLCVFFPFFSGVINGTDVCVCLYVCVYLHTRACVGTASMCYTCVSQSLTELPL